jgi:hypothetical protein
MDQSLRTTILEGQFFQLPKNETLDLISLEYSSELSRLKSAYSISEPHHSHPAEPSPSFRIYGTEYDEVNRTLVGVLALRWIHFNDYESFVAYQPDPIRLRRESFDWICGFYKKAIQSNEDLFTLVISMIINDLGKAPSLATDYARLTGRDISRLNHDMILYQVLHHPAVAAELVPSLCKLSSQHKFDLLLGIKLGAEFNFGQLAQAENVPASMSTLKTDLKNHPRAFELRFMEQLLDIAGAAGHLDHTCAKKVIEPIFHSYHNVYDVAIGILNGDFGLREGYDTILIRRGVLLERAGWNRAKSLNVRVKESRALMRLLCISGAANIETADLYHDTFTGCSLPKSVYEGLVEGLNADGSLEQPAVQPTYLPAMCALAIGNTANGTTQEKMKALTALLIYLARVLVMEKTSPSFKRLPRGVTVVERDLRKAIKPVLESAAFRHNPDVLCEVSVPSDEVANMANGYEWDFTTTSV